MKFTLNNDLRHNRLMRTLLGGLMLFALLYLALDLVFKAEHIGTGYAQIAAYLFGDAEAFLDPVSRVALLEMLHVDIFIAMMLLLSLGAVYARVAGSARLRALLIHTTMVAALAALAAPLLAHVSPLWGFGTDANPFVWVWFGAFLLWHATAAWISLASLFRILRP